MNMTYDEIKQKLLDEGIVTSIQAANATLGYAMQWVHGATFDFTKSSTRVHRARLRKIGLDIKKPFTDQIKLSEQGLAWREFILRNK